jgi:hypothetical protein
MESREILIDEGRYNSFVSTSPQGTIFATTWWLDAVAPNHYRILYVQNGDEIQAAWPIVFKHSKLVGLRIFHPPLSPWLGVLYRPRSSKLVNQLSKEKALSTQLIRQLAKFASLDVRFHRNFTYWSPFYWQGFTQTTGYTYVIDDLSDIDAIWNGLRQNIRTDVKKATKQGVVVEVIDDINRFWEVHRLTFLRQQKPVPYSIDLVRRIDAACRSRGARRIFVGRDQQGDIHAAAYIVWDNRSAYYLMGGSDPEKRSSGATSLVLWKTIQFAATVANAFDFEGSMIESVERFFRAFGATPYPCSRISKVNSPLLFAYRQGRSAISLLRRKSTEWL